MNYNDIDCTKLDILVVDPEMRMPIGRPCLTMVIDTASKCIVGVSVHMEPIKWSTALLSLPLPTQRRHPK